jgi:hypothetical protein
MPPSFDRYAYSISHLFRVRPHSPAGDTLGLSYGALSVKAYSHTDFGLQLPDPFPLCLSAGLSPLPTLCSLLQRVLLLFTAFDSIFDCGVNIAGIHLFVKLSLC